MSHFEQATVKLMEYITILLVTNLRNHPYTNQSAKARNKAQRST